MGLGLGTWASAKVNIAGVFIDQDGGFISVVKTSTGVFTLVLANAIGVTECCPIVTEWYGVGGTPMKITSAANLGADGVTLTVNLFDNITGVAADAAFCVVVSRFMPV